MDWREDLKRAKPMVIRQMQQSPGKLRPREVIDALRGHGVKGDVAKRAIWSLIDDGAIRWRRDRRLEFPEVVDGE